MNIEQENEYVQAAQALSEAPETHEYDNASKQFLSIKNIMAVILEQLGVMPEDYDREKIIESINQYQGTPSAEKIELVGTEDQSPNGKEGTVRYDLRFRVALPEDNSMVMNVEAQHKTLGLQVLVGRAAYYGGRLVSGEKGTIFSRTNYQDLAPVCSIWICQGFDKVRDDLKNTVVYSKPREYVNHHGELFSLGDDYFREIFVFLGGREKIEERTKQDKLLNFLNVCFSPDAPVEERLAAIEQEGVRITNTEKGAMSEMFELGAGILEEGERRGIKKGREEGRVAERVAMITRLSKAGHSPEQLMTELGYNEQEKAEIRKALQENQEGEQKQPFKGGVAAYKEAHESTGKESQKQEQR